MRPLQQITSAVPEAFYQCVCILNPLDRCEVLSGFDVSAIDFVVAAALVLWWSRRD